MGEIRKFEEFDRLVKGFTLSRITLSAVYLDIFTKIGDRSKSANDLSQAGNWDKRGTTILLDALCAIGLLKKKNDLYSNTSFTNKNLRRDKTGFKGWGALHRNTMWIGWSNLTEIITRQPFTRPSNIHNKEFNNYFINAMHQFHYDEAFILADLIKIKKARKMVDVAGGAASYSIAFVKKNKNLVSTVVDLPNTLNVAREKIQEYGVADRVLLKESDLYGPNCDIGEGYDLAWISHLFHAASETENIALLKKVYPALNKGGRVIVNEFYINDDKTAPLEGAVFSVNMLVQTDGGNTYPQKVIKSWLAEAGFKTSAINKSLTVGTKF